MVRQKATILELLSGTPGVDPASDVLYRLREIPTGDLIEGHVAHTEYTDTSVLVALTSGNPTPITLAAGTILGNLGGSLGAVNMSTLLSNLDGDNLTVDYVPSTYTRDASPVEASTVTSLTAHLKGIDTALDGVLSGGGTLAGLSDTSLGNAVDFDFLALDGGSWIGMELRVLSPKLVKTPVAGSGQIGLDVNEAEINHQNLTGAGTQTHLNIDNHIADPLIHRSINDAGSANTDLWSAAQIASYVTANALVNPLTSNLDIAGNSIVDGATTVLEVVTGKTYISGQEVLANLVTSPTTGHVLQYVPANSRWENSLLGALHITVDPTNVGNSSATNLQSMLEDIDGAIAGAGGGQANIGDNVGAGFEVYKDKTSVTLNFRSLVAGNGTILEYVGTSPNDNEIRIRANINDSSGASSTELYSGSYILSLLAAKSDSNHAHSFGNITGVDLTGEVNTDFLVREAGSWKPIDLVMGSGKLTKSASTGAITLDVVPSQISHDSLGNIPASTHFIINDGSTSGTEVWSGSFLTTQLAGKSNTGHTHSIFDGSNAGFAPTVGGVVGTTKFLREDGSWQVPPGAGGSSTFIGLSDVDPAGYVSGDAAKVVRVNAGEDGLEFHTLTASDVGAASSGHSHTNSYFDLVEATEADFTNAANKTVRVNSAGDAFIFDALSFTDLSETPSNYTGADNRFVRIAGTSLAFEEIAADDLSDIAITSPSRYQKLIYGTSGFANGNDPGEQWDTNDVDQTLSGGLYADCGLSVTVSNVEYLPCRVRYYMVATSTLATQALRVRVMVNDVQKEIYSHLEIESTETVVSGSFIINERISVGDVVKIQVLDSAGGTNIITLENAAHPSYIIVDKAFETFSVAGRYGHVTLSSTDLSDFDEGLGPAGGDTWTYNDITSKFELVAGLLTDLATGYEAKGTLLAGNDSHIADFRPPNGDSTDNGRILMYSDSAPKGLAWNFATTTHITNFIEGNRAEFDIPAFSSVDNAWEMFSLGSADGTIGIAKNNPSASGDGTANFSFTLTANLQSIQDVNMTGKAAFDLIGWDSSNSQFSPYEIRSGDTNRLTISKSHPSSPNATDGTIGISLGVLLTSLPADLTGATGSQALRRNSGNTDWEWFTPNFLELSDIGEANYVGHEGDFVRVNSTPNGLEFVNIISRADLAADIIDGSKLEDNAVNSEHIAAGAVTNTKLGADSVTSTKIADNAVDSEHITAGAVDESHLSFDPVELQRVYASACGGTGDTFLGGVGSINMVAKDEGHADIVLAACTPWATGGQINAWRFDRAGKYIVRAKQTIRTLFDIVASDWLLKGAVTTANRSITIDGGTGPILPGMSIKFDGATGAHAREYIIMHVNDPNAAEIVCTLHENIRASDTDNTTLVIRKYHQGDLAVTGRFYDSSAAVTGVDTPGDWAFNDAVSGTYVYGYVSIPAGFINDGSADSPACYYQLATEHIVNADVGDMFALIHSSSTFGDLTSGSSIFEASRQTWYAERIGEFE